MINRLTRLLLVAAAVGALVVPGAALASDGMSFPQSRAEWDAMSPADQTALMERQRAKLDALLASGEAQIRTVYGTTGQQVPQSPTSPTPMDFSAAATSVSRQCYVQWIVIPGEGDWVRGGGYTSASAEVDRIWAGRPTRPGKFYRDGEWKGDWYQQRQPGSYAERYTDYHWAFWWEYVHWTTQGWHGAYDNGVYLMNDSYCFAQKWM